ncbi:MAG: winged helix-turn-helix transcriptional regulator [Anaerolineales bacterium]|nr:winged helix-turn-helix transcriptional regulator [Anaerolineales bacterium]
MNLEKLELEVNLLHSEVCSALGDPKRILILYLLADHGCFVNEISIKLGIPQSTVSRHLRILRDRNLVVTNRNGNSIQYCISDMRLITALNLMREMLKEKLENQAEIIQ